MSNYSQNNSYHGPFGPSPYDISGLEFSNTGMHRLPTSMEDINLRGDRRAFPEELRLSDFEFGEAIGEGTFGVVQVAKKDGKKYAIKKILPQEKMDGIPFTTVREIKSLKRLKHKNIIEFIGIICVPGNVKEITPEGGQAGLKSGEIKKKVIHTLPEYYLPFPYMDHDLAGLIKNPNVIFSGAQIKCYMQQLLEGIAYIHSKFIMHRDLKPANLLINNQGILKIADFGLSRSLRGMNAKYTPVVVTRWYRPIEVLLEKADYDFSVDMWSIGCIFYEMLIGKPLFPGDSDIDQINRIFKMMGTPTEELVPGFNKFQEEKGINFTMYSRKIEKELRNWDPDTLDLLLQFLTYSPFKRITAQEALSHRYFTEGVEPAYPEELPVYESSHESVIYENQNLVSNSYNSLDLTRSGPAFDQYFGYVDNNSSYDERNDHDNRNDHSNGSRGFEINKDYNEYDKSTNNRDSGKGSVSHKSKRIAGESRNSMEIDSSESRNKETKINYDYYSKTKTTPNKEKSKQDNRHSSKNDSPIMNNKMAYRNDDKRSPKNISSKIKNEKASPYHKEWSKSDINKSINKRSYHDDKESYRCDSYRPNDKKVCHNRDLDKTPSKHDPYKSKSTGSYNNPKSDI